MKPLRCRCGFLLLGIVLGAKALAADGAPDTAAEPVAPASLWSKDDGWLDISGFIDQAYGFVPLLIPITEPAVGLGAAGALVFIDKPKAEANAGFGRPNISVIGALGTENGTRGEFAGDMRHWLDDSVKSLVGVVHASVNLDFYGIGRDSQLQHSPQSYNLETTAGVVQGRYRIGDSPAWVGLGYVLASTTVKFAAPQASAGLPGAQSESRVGGLLPTISYDTRDNLFTPTRGSYLDLSAGLFSKAMGSDTDFKRINLSAIHYQPISRDLTLGVMGGRHPELRRRAVLSAPLRQPARRLGDALSGRPCRPA